MAAEFLQEEPSDKWVLISHGYTGCKEEMYTYARWFYEQGYNCFLPDLRCQGDSEGDYIGMGWTDHYDCIKWINRLVEEYPDCQIVLMCQSMGAATVNLMTGENLPKNVVAAISDCAYATTEGMMDDKCVRWFHLPTIFVDSVRIDLILRGGYDLFDSRPVDAVRNSTTPTLYIHGDLDEMVPVDSVYELYEACSAKKQLYVVEGAGHCQAKNKNPEAYYEQISGFLESID